MTYREEGETKKPMDTSWKVELIRKNRGTRILLAAIQLLQRPQDGIRYLGNRIDGKGTLALGLPWISWSCIDWLSRHLRPGMRIFEFGGGGSTIFFAAHGCFVVTAENYPEWQEKIRERLAELSLSHSSKIHFIDCSGDRRNAAREYLLSVREDGPYDLVSVDGDESLIGRMSCIEEARTHVKPGGWLILDDAHWPEYEGADRLLPGWKKQRFWGFGPSRRGVQSTDVWIRPG